MMWLCVLLTNVHNFGQHAASDDAVNGAWEISLLVQSLFVGREPIGVLGSVLLVDQCQFSVSVRTLITTCTA